MSIRENVPVDEYSVGSDWNDVAQPLISLNDTE